MGEVEALLVRGYSATRRRLNTIPAPREPVIVKYVCVCCERESLDVPFKPAGRPNVRRIVNEVSTLTGISVDDIMSDRRNAKIVHARHLAMYLARYFTMLSTTQIGRLIGGRDHTTVIHGVRQTAARKPDLRHYENLWGGQQ